VRFITKTLTLSQTVAAALLCASTIASAGGPVVLGDGQLDRVTAGGALVFSTADAQATGLITQASAGANSAFGSNTGVQDGFGSEAGVTSGTAVSLGSNGAAKGGPPATSSTSVTTGGVPEGNYTMTISANKTSSALGLTIQGGFTFVYGVFVPGL
jgi:hypothetical protein